MGFGVIFVKVFSVVLWPSFNLIYPLCVSIWAIKSESDDRNRQCLTYWVLFALITLLELVLADILEWFTYWPYTKGIITLLLLMPYFGASSYIYKGFVRPYIAVHIHEIVFNPTKKDDASDVNIILDESKEFLEIGQADFWTSTDNYDERHDSCPSDPTIRTNVKKEWSCALCLVSTASNKCLNSHLRGKKHKINEEELKTIVLSKKREVEVKSRSLLYKPNSMVLLQNWSGFLSPVTTAIRWCRWERPEFGWTKLNTDGSICKTKSSFGGLLRDQNGDPICAYVSKSQSFDTFLVELLAVWRGLVIARSLSIKVIWVESDSLSVVKTINRKQAYNSSKGANCLKQIWQLLKKFEMCHVSHAWRETNKAADHLAKLDFGESDVIIWPADFSISLWNIIKNDARGKWFPRR